MNQPPTEADRVAALQREATAREQLAFARTHGNQQAGAR